MQIDRPLGKDGPASFFFFAEGIMMWAWPIVLTRILEDHGSRLRWRWTRCDTKREPDFGQFHSETHLVSEGGQANP